MTAANTIDAKQGEPIEVNAFQGSTFDHRDILTSGG